MHVHVLLLEAFVAKVIFCVFVKTNTVCTFLRNDSYTHSNVHQMYM